jgi:hypothetical protein
VRRARKARRLEAEELGQAGAVEADDHLVSDDDDGDRHLARFPDELVAGFLVCGYVEIGEGNAV